MSHIYHKYAHESNLTHTLITWWGWVQHSNISMPCQSHNSSHFVPSSKGLKFINHWMLPLQMPYQDNTFPLLLFGCSEFITLSHPFHMCVFTSQPCPHLFGAGHLDAGIAAGPTHLYHLDATNTTFLTFTIWLLTSQCPLMVTGVSNLYPANAHLGARHDHYGASIKPFLIHIRLGADIAATPPQILWLP